MTYLTASAARASAILRDGKLTRFDLDLWQPQAKDASLGADVNRTLSAARAQFHLLARPDNTIDVALKVEDAQIGKAYKPAFGAAMALLDLRGAISQAQVFDALASGHQNVFDAAEQWRVTGGQLKIEKLDLNWGSVKTTMTGALALDTAHDINGSVSGAFDTSALVSALTHGALTLSGTGQANLSLIFKDGDILIGSSPSNLVGVKSQGR